MKMIGVLGGLGPQATVHFQQLVLESSQRILPQRFNTGYPPMVVHYHRGSPMAMDDSGHTLQPLRPAPALLEMAERVGRNADLLVIVSNGVHRFARELQAAAGLPIVHLIDIVLDEVARRGWRRVGVMTAWDPSIYAQPLQDRGFEAETLGLELQGALDEGIGMVMEGRVGAEQRAAARAALETLRARGVDGTILGCTEIPFLLDEHGRPDSPDLLDPLPLLAEAAVREAAGL